jgi:hypothetical protein
MAISIDLRVLARKLEKNSDDILVKAASKDKATFEKVAQAIAAASTLLEGVADDMDENGSLDFRPEQLDEIAALASSFAESNDPLLQKQASVLDEILLSIASPKNALAKANQINADEINRLREARKKGVHEDLYEKPKQALDKMNLVSQQSKAVNSQIKTFRPLEAPLQTRYAPDMPGNMLSRIADGVYQDIITGKVYDYKEGYTTVKGNKIPGSSVEGQTRDLGDTRQQSNSLFENREGVMARNAAPVDDLSHLIKHAKATEIAAALRKVRDHAPHLMNTALDECFDLGMSTREVAEILSTGFEDHPGGSKKKAELGFLAEPKPGEAYPVRVPKVKGPVGVVGTPEERRKEEEAIKRIFEETGQIVPSMFVPEESDEYAKKDIYEILFANLVNEGNFDLAAQVGSHILAGMKAAGLKDEFIQRQKAFLESQLDGVEIPMKATASIAQILIKVASKKKDHELVLTSLGEAGFHRTIKKAHELVDAVSKEVEEEDCYSELKAAFANLLPDLLHNRSDDLVQQAVKIAAGFDISIEKIGELLAFANVTSTDSEDQMDKFLDKYVPMIRSFEMTRNKLFVKYKLLGKSPEEIRQAMLHSQLNMTIEFIDDLMFTELESIVTCIDKDKSTSDSATIKKLLTKFAECEALLDQVRTMLGKEPSNMMEDYFSLYIPSEETSLVEPHTDPAKITAEYDGDGLFLVKMAMEVYAEDGFKFDDEDEELAEVYSPVTQQPSETIPFPFSVGEKVKIVEGPARDRFGTILEILPDKVKVNVTVYTVQQVMYVSKTAIAKIPQTQPTGAGSGGAEPAPAQPQVRIFDEPKPKLEALSLPEEMEVGGKLLKSPGGKNRVAWETAYRYARNQALEEFAKRPDRVSKWRGLAPQEVLERTYNDLSPEESSEMHGDIEEYMPNLYGCVPPSMVKSYVKRMNAGDSPLLVEFLEYYTKTFPDKGNSVALGNVPDFVTKLGLDIDEDWLKQANGRLRAMLGKNDKDGMRQFFNELMSGNKPNFTAGSKYTEGTLNEPEVNIEQYVADMVIAKAGAAHAVYSLWRRTWEQREKAKTGKDVQYPTKRKDPAKYEEAKQEQAIWELDAGRSAFAYFTNQIMEFGKIKYDWPEGSNKPYVDRTTQDGVPIMSMFSIQPHDYGGGPKFWIGPYRQNVINTRGGGTGQMYFRPNELAKRWMKDDKMGRTRPGSTTTGLDKKQSPVAETEVVKTVPNPVYDFETGEYVVTGTEGERGVVGDGSTDLKTLIYNDLQDGFPGKFSLQDVQYFIKNNRVLIDDEPTTDPEFIPDEETFVEVKILFNPTIKTEDLKVPYDESSAKEFYNEWVMALSAWDEAVKENPKAYNAEDEDLRNRWIREYLRQRGWVSPYDQTNENPNVTWNDVRTQAQRIKTPERKPDQVTRSIVDEAKARVREYNNTIYGRGKKQYEDEDPFSFDWDETLTEGTQFEAPGAETPKATPEAEPTTESKFNGIERATIGDGRSELSKLIFDDIKDVDDPPSFYKGKYTITDVIKMITEGRVTVADDDGAMVVVKKPSFKPMAGRLVEAIIDLDVGGNATPKTAPKTVATTIKPVVDSQGGRVPSSVITQGEKTDWDKWHNDYIEILKENPEGVQELKKKQQGKDYDKEAVSDLERALHLGLMNRGWGENWLNPFSMRTLTDNEKKLFGGVSNITVADYVKKKMQQTKEEREAELAAAALKGSATAATPEGAFQSRKNHFLNTLNTNIESFDDDIETAEAAGDTKKARRLKTEKTKSIKALCDSTIRNTQDLISQPTTRPYEGWGEQDYIELLAKIKELVERERQKLIKK